MKTVTNYVDKANRHYRRMRKKNPSLLPLVSGGGRVIGNGSKVELTAENGATLVYRVEPRIEYVAVLEKSFPPPKAAAASPAATFDANLKQIEDTALDLLAGLENQLADLKRQMSALEAEHPHDNVVPFNNVAAE